MYINLNRYRINSYNNPKAVAFEGSYDKLLAKIKNCNNFRKLAIRYEEAKKVYENLGYRVEVKSGSHSIVTMPDGFAFPLVLPHGSNKVISATDVKRLFFAINGDIVSLKNMSKI